MMEEIYRVQDKNGRGPYKPGFSHKWVVQDRTEFDRPPFYAEFPLETDNLLIGPNYGSGFRTLNQLNWWFSDIELEKLKKYGYNIVKLKVDNILAESSKQLVFSCYKPIKKCVIKKIF